VEAISWDIVKDWLEHRTEHKVQLRKRSSSAATLRRSNVEFSASAVSLHVPNFGWFSPVPQFRIATSLPTAPSLSFSFDFTYAKSSHASGSGETLSLTIPAVASAWQAGSALAVLRRHEFLGGLYIGGGAAAVQLDRSLRQTLEQANIRSWTAVFDAGWRYRLPGRSWGLAATYREGVVLDSGARELYPRFRSFNYGVFVVFK
jgi:hypothetical protein